MKCAFTSQMTYTLLRAGGFYQSITPGLFGGHKKQKIYGRLDCRTALAAIERGGYVKDRVFFESEAMAKRCGYRPCAVCMPAEYAAWKK